jgi:hypothetical protein
MRKAKFASEIFCHKSWVANAAMQKENAAHGLGTGSKQREINGFGVACNGPKADVDAAGLGRLRTRSCGFAGRGPKESQSSLMPRYFFNTRIGDELISDPDGEELRNPDRAWEMARAMILELLKTEGTDERLLNATVEVTDDEGEFVLEFPFAEALLNTPDDQSATRH